MKKPKSEREIEQLQDRILDRWGATEAELGPLLYKLRIAMKKQGSRKGLGFTAWLAEHGIPRTTAIRWADNYAVRIGKKRPPAPPESTDDSDFVPDGTKSGAVEEGTTKVHCMLTLQVTDAERNELLTAWETLGNQRATHLILDTLARAVTVESGVETAIAAASAEQVRIECADDSDPEKRDKNDRLAVECIFVLTLEEKQAFMQSVRKLGELRATQVMYTSVTKEAKNGAL